MTSIEWSCIVLTILVVLGASLVSFLEHKKAVNTLMKAQSMIDDAINGRFNESILDESQLSALEAKLARYLSVSTVSSKNLKEEKDKIKELIADISHQTKTPIASILLYSELLSEKEMDEMGEVCIKALKTQAEKLSFLISALVKVSRLETGVIQVMPKPEKLQKLLDTVYEEILPKLEKKDIEFTLLKTEAVAYFDLKWTAEALYNIVDNAVKYISISGKIKMEVKVYELFIRIDVRDNGPGIAREEQSKIFKRFYRSPAVMGEEGVGIGLFLAREIIAAQGGYIKVHSKLGEGTTFSIFLPRRE